VGTSQFISSNPDTQQERNTMKKKSKAPKTKSIKPAASKTAKATKKKSK
jgi:hypothetical protein